MEVEFINTIWVFSNLNRYSEEIKEVTYPDTVFITMLRDPVKNFESEFGFFRDYPFPQWVGVNGTLDSFMSDPSRFYDKSTPWYFRAKNYMSFDLGLEHETESDAYIQQAIGQLESTYHLVLLTDYFEESLILLKVNTSLVFSSKFEKLGTSLYVIRRFDLSTTENAQ